LIRFDVFSASNSISPDHPENQDTYLVDLPTLLFAVADGVGGYKGGKEASELAIGALRNRASEIVDEQSMIDGLKEIHEQLQQSARSCNYPNMGTTIAVAKVVPDYGAKNTGKVLTSNVGDSPILLFSANAIDDSEFAKAYTDDSFRGRDPSSMWAITQYLGIEDYDLQVHTQTFDYLGGDILLICSDGVTDNLQDAGAYAKKRVPELGELIRRYSSAKKIVEEALNAGIKPDDMTALLVFL
jgi:PPM family protein phosphatase